MNRILLILLSVIFFSSPASAITESQRERLDEFAQNFLEKRKFAVGYPGNQETSLGDFYAWYMKHELYRVAMNNVGDPYKHSPTCLSVKGTCRATEQADLKTVPSVPTLMEECMDVRRY